MSNVIKTSKTCGIVLAGGNGTRLHPLTHAISKQLLPVYNKPMIYYPIATLAGMGIKDIMIITAPDQQELFKDALGPLKLHEKLGVNLVFRIQENPRGLPEAFLIAADWVKFNDVVLILGDNIIINNSPIIAEGNSIFTFEVSHPERYGVVETHPNGFIKQLVEKPQHFISNDAVIGLYSFRGESKICQLARTLKPSARGELEIVELIKLVNQLDFPVRVHKLDGFWFDAGNHDDLLDCANLVRAIETRSSRKLL